MGAIVKAVNRAYGLQETRPWWKLWGISMLMGLGFVLVVVSLALWDILRWAGAFLAVSLAHAILYYVAPNAEVPFKWITPGGFAVTVLILVSSVGLNVWVPNLGRYDQVYGQVGRAIMVLIQWLHVTGMMVLVGTETNAVLARAAEERKDIKIVQPRGFGEQSGTQRNSTTG